MKHIAEIESLKESARQDKIKYEEELLNMELERRTLEDKVAASQTNSPASVRLSEWDTPEALRKKRQSQEIDLSIPSGETLKVEDEGVSKLEAEVQELKAQVNNLQENLRKAESDRTKWGEEMELERRSRKDVESALQTLQIEKEHLTEQLEKEKSALEQQRLEWENKQREEETVKFKALEAEISNLQRCMKDGQLEWADRLEESEQKYTNEKETWEKQRMDLETHIAGEKAKLSQEMILLQEQVEKLTAEKQRSESELATLQATTRELEESKATISQQLEQEKEKLSALENSLTQEMEKLRLENSKLVVERTRMEESMREQLTNSSKETNDEIERLSSELEAEKAKFTDTLARENERWTTVLREQSDKFQEEQERRDKDHSEELSKLQNPTQSGM